MAPFNHFRQQYTSIACRMLVNWKWGLFVFTSFAWINEDVCRGISMSDSFSLADVWVQYRVPQNMLLRFSIVRSAIVPDNGDSPIFHTLLNVCVYESFTSSDLTSNIWEVYFTLYAQSLFVDLSVYQLSTTVANFHMNFLFFLWKCHQFIDNIFITRGLTARTSLLSVTLFWSI